MPTDTRVAADVCEVAALVLAAMGIEIDRLTDEQTHCLASWDMGT